jgi:hypothetical protein
LQSPHDCGITVCFAAIRAPRIRERILQKAATMAKKPGSRAEFVFFNVLYEDGSQRSNRRVPADAIEGQDPDALARAAIEAQDREIAEKSGLPPPRVKTITRVKK